jgi:hypothetical protein
MEPGHNWQSIVSPDLVGWMNQDSGEVRDLIVEARLPTRKVRFQGPLPLRPTASGVEGGGPERVATLEHLRSYVSDVLRIPTSVLQAAGALVISANSRQVRELATHELVKAIRPNRRLRPVPRDPNRRGMRNVRERR